MNDSHLSGNNHGFGLFLEEYLHEHKGMSVAEAIPMATYLWNNMSVIRKNAKYAVLDDLSKTLYQQIDNDLELATLIQWLYTRGALKSERFFFIDILSDGLTVEGQTIASEIAIAEFSFEQGFISYYLVNLSDVLQVDGQLCDRTAVEKVYEALSLHLKQWKDFNWILYCQSESLLTIWTLFEYIQMKFITSTHKLKIYSVESLYRCLKKLLKRQFADLALDEVSAIVNKKVDNINDERLVCKHHRASQAQNKCPLSVAIRLAYIMADGFCKELDIELIPGQHTAVPDFHPLESKQYGQQEAVATVLKTQDTPTTENEGVPEAVMAEKKRPPIEVAYYDLKYDEEYAYSLPEEEGQKPKKGITFRIYHNRRFYPLSRNLARMRMLEGYKQNSQDKVSDTNAKNDNFVGLSGPTYVYYGDNTVQEKAVSPGAKELMKSKGAKACKMRLTYGNFYALTLRKKSNQIKSSDGNSEDSENSEASEASEGSKVCSRPDTIGKSQWNLFPSGSSNEEPIFQGCSWKPKNSANACENPFFGAKPLPTFSSEENSSEDEEEPQSHWPRESASQKADRQPDEITLPSADSFSVSGSDHEKASKKSFTGSSSFFKYAACHYKWTHKNNSNNLSNAETEPEDQKMDKDKNSCGFRYDKSFNNKNKF